ncbi:MAG: hypothetical protein ACFFAD_00245 [Candidatus Hermodarchaeota archaeon]
MREISIHLPKEEYSPGERVEGHAIVVCDDDFDCESVNLVFSCTEQSRVVVGSGKHRRVFLEKFEYFAYYLEIFNQSTVMEGETRFEFAFELPKESVSSFEGTYSWIRYEIKGKIEVKWALDPKTERRIVVTAPPKESVELEQTMIQKEISNEGRHLLRVELDSNTIRRGDYIRFRYLVGSDTNIRGVRAELILREKVSPQGRDTNNDNEMDQQYWEEDKILRESWVDVTVKTGEEWPEAFKSELIEHLYILKVTLDIPWRLDKSIEIPLKLRRDIIQDEFSSSIFDF